MVVLLAIAFLLSVNKKKISLRTVGAALVLQVVMMGLDLTNQTVCTPDVIARMERAGGPAGELFSDIMNFTLKTQFENYGLAGGPVHDATCIGYLINPDGIKTQEMYVEVDVNSGPCYGRTVCDEIGRAHV